MIYAIIVVVGLAVGALAGWLAGKTVGRKALEPEVARLAERADQAQRQLAQEREQAALRLAAEQEQAQRELAAERERATRMLEQVRGEGAARLAEQRADAEKTLADMREAHEATLTRMRDDYRSQRAETDRQWQARFEALKTELGKIQADALAVRQAALTEQNSRQIGDLLAPVREQFEEFRKSAAEARTAGEVGRRELQSAFESQIKLFAEQQNRAVSEIREQSQRIGTDAATLARALKGDTRAQGKWGEMVLEHILEQSGLRRDFEFRVQQVLPTGESRAIMRPDVVVSLPHSRSVIIDSKVSLTAYTSAIEVENDLTGASTGEAIERARHFMSEHARSVRRHVDELASKSYADLQPGSIDMVLMFLPTDSALIAALRQQPDLGEYAFNRKVVIITPTNLMMTLKLIHNLWQQERQQQNVERIVARGNELYSRMAGFMETFTELQTHIDRMQRSYVTAEKRLTGRGGLVSQFEMLRKLGLTPKKRIKGAETVEEDDDAADEPSADNEIAQNGVGSEPEALGDGESAIV